MFFYKNAHSARYSHVFLGVQIHIKKKAGMDIAGFLVCFFGHQSTPLSSIRPLPAQFALFFPYLLTLYSFHHVLQTFSFRAKLLFHGVASLFANGMYGAILCKYLLLLHSKQHQSMLKPHFRIEVIAIISLMLTCR